MVMTNGGPVGDGHMHCALSVNELCVSNISPRGLPWRWGGGDGGQILFHLRVTI